MSENILSGYVTCVAMDKDDGSYYALFRFYRNANYPIRLPISKEEFDKLSKTRNVRIRYQFDFL